jgi:hypothetical protein
MEACIHDKGFDLLRSLMTQTAAAQPEAKKKGAVSAVVPAAAMRSSSRARNARS